MILFVNACVRPGSRTRELAEHLLSKLADEVQTVNIYESDLPELDAEGLNQRERACAAADFADPDFTLARQFAAADTVVIAAPYWDLSFPARLKQYIESICVNGLSFCYSATGEPQGLCRAGRLYYVTTAGGLILHREFGFGYLQALSRELFGIPQCRFVSAEKLDIAGSDVAAIMRQAKAEIDSLLAAD